MKSDLHIHTLYSDGVFSPEKIVDTAIDVGLQVIALTDHDNVLSYPVAKDYLRKTNRDDKLEIIQGIEVNTLYKNYEVHILGYFMDVNNNDFQNMLKIQQQARVKQTKEIINLLSKKEGIKIKFEDIRKLLKKYFENGKYGMFSHETTDKIIYGNKTNVIMANKEVMGSIWYDLEPEKQYDIIALLFFIASRVERSNIDIL